jgi:hypothetical protein
MVDPRRDYPNFTDAALDFFIRRFPSHPDHAAALAEFERRRKDRDQRGGPVSEKASPVGRGFLIWAIAGILILALALLFLTLPILTARTHRKPGPISFSEPSASVHRSWPSAKGTSRGAAFTKALGGNDADASIAAKLTP